MIKKLLPLVVATILALPSIADAQCPVPGFKFAAFGDLTMDVTGGGQVRSYDSRTLPPFTPVCGTDADLGTNSIASNAIKVAGGSAVCGEVQFGLGGTSGTVVQLTGGATIAGSTTCTTASCSEQIANIFLPSVVLPSPALPAGGNSTGTATLTPGREYGTVDAGNTEIVTLNAGTYVIDQLDMKNGSQLVVGTGPITIFIKTKLDVAGTLTNTGLKATDLVFMGADTLTTVGINSAGTVTSFGIYAPKADVTLNGSADFFGAFVGKTIKIAGGANLNYDQALSTFATTGLVCPEVARNSPIVATVDGSSCVVQGTREFVGGTPTVMNTTADVATFSFPGSKGHMRARTTASITTTATNFSTGSVVFDAANGIPIPASPAGTACALSGTGFSGACRNVFTNTNAAPGALGHTTFTGDPMTVRIKMFETANADLIGNLIAPSGVIPGLTTAHKTTILQRVVRSELGGVDRSTVAVVPPSNVAGVGTRPTMAYFGGTDGMLHAVCASTGGATPSNSNVCPTTMPDGSAPPTGTIPGTELWAFVPRVQLPLIRTNKQRLDGSVRVVDVFGAFPDAAGAPSTTRTFRTILTFQTGFSDATTKPAVYAFDVTDPARPILLWEYATPGTLSSDGFDLGTGLAMHAGPTIASGAILNLAVAQTNNGGSYGSDCATVPDPTLRCGGMLATALKLETGERLWDYGFPYVANSETGPRTVGADNYRALSSGIPGGAVGVDLGGAGFTTDVVMGDLFGNLWRLDAATGKSALGTTGDTPTGGFRTGLSAGNTQFGGLPMFQFAANFHPIGALPAILDNGFKVAVFGSGAYADPTDEVPVWTTAQQKLIGVKLTGGATLTDAAAVGSALGQLTINKDLVAGEKVLGQALVVGTEVFVTTDTSDINSATYGGTTAVTGKASVYNITGTTLVALDAIQGGASSIAGNGAALYAGAGNKGQQVASGGVQYNATTTGLGVDFMKTPKASRLAWLDTRF